MANIGELTDNKLISLSLQGYNPFQPDKGIFCGGYQGILYPNPTTLVADGFDPYEFLEFMPTAYTPGGHYNGLGKGNPGIDYKNPGHILGILDTFGRMSYGLRMLLDTHAGSNPGSFQPIVDIDMPLLTANVSPAPIGLSDIYPLFTEIPSDWFNTFSIDSTGVITPETHILSANIIELQNFTDLFDNKSLSSYLGLVQYFRDTIQQLASSVSSLNNKIAMDFTLEEGIPGGVGFTLDGTTWEQYAGLSQGAIFAPTSDTWDVDSVRGTAYFQYHTSTASEALNILTGSDAYHNGPNGLLEYRSLTELNSVINLVPLQMAGGTYQRKITSPDTDPLNEVSLVLEVGSFMLVDFIINVSNTSSETQTVTLRGEAIVKNVIPNPEDYGAVVLEGITETFVIEPLPVGLIGVTIIEEFPPRTRPAIESATKTIKVTTSINNELSWDQSWLGVGVVNDEEVFQSTTFVQAQGQSVANKDPLTVDFLKTFVLKPGCNSIRVTANMKSIHDLIKPGSLRSEFWSRPTYFIGDIIFVNIFSDVDAGDPGNVGNSFQAGILQFSLNVTGTNMSPKTYSVEI